MAAAVRLLGIGLAPLTFQPGRQLIDALMARGYWLHLGGTLPSGVAETFTPWVPPYLEPPLVQWLGAIGYAVTGGERLWIPRAVLAIVWVLVAPAVWALLRREASTTAAAAGAAVWLFLPYGVALSRALMPDGLLVCVIVLALWAMVRSDDLGTPRAEALALGLGAVAVFIKPTAALAVVPALLALVGLRSGWRGLLRWGVAARITAMLAPAGIYWVTCNVLGVLPEDKTTRLSLSGLLDADFLLGWARMVGNVIGLVGLVIALLGLMVAPRRLKVLGVALLAGYAVHAAAFVYHTPTHDYYHVLLLPPVVLGVGAFAGKVGDVVAERSSAQWAPGLVAAGTCVALLLLAPRPYPLVETDLPSSLAAMVGAAETAGPALGHSDHVLFVARADGLVQQYYGYLAGPSWPQQGSLEAEAAAGIAPRGARERLEEMDAASRVEWVLVTEPAVLTEQPDLAALIAEEFVPGPSGEGWAAYRRR